MHEPLTVVDANDRTQLEVSLALSRNNECLEQNETIIRKEDELIAKMIYSSSLSIQWLIIRVNDENSLFFQNYIGDLIGVYDAHSILNWPEFGPSMRLFAIGVLNGNTRKLSPGIKNSESQILLYWSERIVDNDQQKYKSSIKLTKREYEVLGWASEGKTSLEISGILGISPKTVNLHADNLINKLNASNRTHAVVRAIHLGLI